MKALLFASCLLAVASGPGFAESSFPWLFHTRAKAVPLASEASVPAPQRETRQREARKLEKRVEYHGAAETSATGHYRYPGLLNKRPADGAILQTSFAKPIRLMR